MKTLELSEEITLNATEVKLKKILFATDFSPFSNAALPYALAIAHKYGAKLYAVHVLSTGTYVLATPETWSAARQYQEQKQEAAVARLVESVRGVPHQVMSAVGDVSDVIFRLIRDHEIDLLVLGTHGRGGFRKLLLGSVAEKIFRMASCPVLTVGPQAPNEGKNKAEFKRILYATDFSDESLAAASYAVSFTEQHQAHLSLLHVLEEPQAGTVDFEPNADFVIRRMQEIVPPRPDSPLRPDYEVEFGRAEEQIVNFVHAHKIDLVVLGVRAPQGPLTSVTHLAHSKAQHIAGHATCPVLTIRG